MRLNSVTAAPFGGHQIAANSVRLLVIFVGFSIALLCLGVAVRAWRSGDRSWAIGITAVALLVAHPAVNGLTRFNAPLNPLGLTLYTLGLLLGFIALSANYTIAPDWIKPRRHHTKGRDA